MINKLSECKTADGRYIGIGSEVYAITMMPKMNKFGRIYSRSAKELTVVKATIYKVTYIEANCPGWVYWTADAGAFSIEAQTADGSKKEIEAYPSEVSEYTAYDSEDAAKAAMEAFQNSGGLFVKQGYPLMPLRDAETLIEMNKKLWEEENGD